MKPKLRVSCKLIGICGHAGSGKDTVGDYISERDDTYLRAFAMPVKEAAAAMFGLPLSVFSYYGLKEQKDLFWEISPRQMAQFVGTEMVRDTIHKLLPDIGADFWIYRLAYDLNGNSECVPYDSNDVVVITDVRFQNEYDWIIENGGIIIHLTRDGADGTVGIPGHASEAEICFHNFERTYHVYNNGTIEQLKQTVDGVLHAAKMHLPQDPEAF